MNNKRSARLRFVAAIWLVLSVVVFGTLIGVAWMSMNETADVSADVFIVDSVDKSTLARARILDCVDRAHVVDCIDGEFEEVIMAYRSHSVERRVDPPLNPIAPGYMLERWVGPSENPIAPGYMRDS